jgi:hypothetical protein
MLAYLDLGTALYTLLERARHTSGGGLLVLRNALGVRVIGGIWMPVGRWLWLAVAELRLHLPRHGGED